LPDFNTFFSTLVIKRYSGLLENIMAVELRIIVTEAAKKHIHTFKAGLNANSYNELTHFHSILKKYYVDPIKYERQIMDLLGTDES
jgi:hypothetical protein